MSTKPTVIPRWANVSGAVTTPSSGKQDVGFVVAEKPAAQYFNWLFLQIYLWCQYLSDQVFTGTVQAGSLVATTNVTTPEADIRHGDKTVVLGARSATFLSGGWAHVGGSTQQLQCPTATSADCYLSVPLAVGDRLKSIRLVCDTPGAASDVVAVAYKSAPGIGGASAGAAVSLATAAATATSNVQGVTATLGTPYTQAVDESVNIVVSAAGTTGAKTLFFVEVTYDRP